MQNMDGNQKINQYANTIAPVVHTANHPAPVLPPILRAELSVVFSALAIPQLSRVVELSGKTPFMRAR